MATFKTKAEAQAYITRFLGLTKSMWRKSVIPASVGNQMMKDATTYIGSDGELNEFGRSIAASIEASGEKMPVKYFDAIDTLAGKIDLKKVAVQERVSRWLNSTRNALRAQLPSADLVRDPRWLGVEELRTKQNPVILVEVYKQGMFPQAQSLMADLMILYPFLANQNVPSTSPPPMSQESAAIVQQAALPEYEESEVKIIPILIGLGVLGGTFWYAKRLKLI